MMANFWFKFEWDAWQSDRKLKRCSFETRGFWVECILLMEEAGECFLDGTPDEVANLLGCSIEVLRRCVGELKRSGTAEITATATYVKILSRRLLKRINIREYNRLKQQEHRCQADVNVMSNECQDPKSIRVKESLSETDKEESPGGDPPDASTCLPADEKPARKSTVRKTDPRKSHPAIICTLQASKRYPPKDLWDAVIAALGNKPDSAFFTQSYIAWRSFGGAPGNYESWLFEPAKTGKIPEKFTNGKYRPNNGNGKRTDAEVIEQSADFYDNYPS